MTTPTPFDPARLRSEAKNLRVLAGELAAEIKSGGARPDIDAVNHLAAAVRDLADGIVALTGGVAESGAPAAAPVQQPQSAPAATPQERPAQAAVSAPAEPQTAASPAPARSESAQGVDAALASLISLNELVEKSDLAVPAAELAFTGKVAAVWKKVAGSDKAPRVLSDIIGFLDDLANRYGRLPGGGQLRAAAMGQAANIAHILPQACSGAEVYPTELGETIASIASRPECPVQKKNSGPVSQSACGHHYFESRGLRAGGQVIQPAVFISNGMEANQTLTLLETMAGELFSTKARHATREARGRALTDVMKLMKQIESGEQISEDLALRQALNGIDAVSESGDLEGAKNPALARLREIGFQELRVPLNDRFDDRFGPNKYERVKVASEKAAGTIVRVVQRGWTNKDGAVVQKARVGVSAGKGGEG
jgi:hypothetical protein